MSVTAARLRHYTAVKVDTQAIALAALFLFVTLASILLVPFVASTGSEPALAGESTTTKAAAGGAWALAEAGLAGVLLLFALLWKRLPSWLQDVIEDTLTYGLVFYVGGITMRGALPFDTMLAVFVGAFFVLKTVTEFDLWWIVNNILAIGLAVFVGSFAGVILGIPIIAVGLVGLSIYDHYFANKKEWMFTLGKGLLYWKVPVLILLPTQFRIGWDDIVAGMAGTEEADDDPIGMGIGMADVALPAMFAAAVAARPVSELAAFGIPVEVMGVVAGITVAVLRLRWVMENKGSGAGLPALATGTLAGWGIVALPLWLLL